MRRWSAGIIALVFGLTVGSVCGSDDPRPPDLLISELNWVRFDVVFGRVLATCTRTKQDRHRIRRDYPSGAAESVAVSMDRGLISLRYSLQSDDHQLTVDVIRRDQLDIQWSHRSRDGHLWRVVYRQRREGDVEFIVASDDGQRQSCRAKSLWHLLYGYHELCREHLVPVLEGLRPNWMIDDDLVRITVNLMDGPDAGQHLSRNEVQSHVEQLSAQEFQVRQRADRLLRAMGPEAFCYLEEIDLSKLDTEQGLHVKSILAGARRRGMDTPRRVAAWLSNDVHVWLSLANSRVADHRRVACGQLRRLTGKPIEFDPEAEPEQRAARWAELYDVIRR